jgi:hypothetical protein
MHKNSYKSFAAAILLKILNLSFFLGLAFIQIRESVVKNHKYNLKGKF